MPKHRNLFTYLLTKRRNLFTLTPQLIHLQNTVTYSHSKHRNLFTHQNQPRLEATPTHAKS